MNKKSDNKFLRNEKIKQKILKITLGLIADKGHDAVSMREIAKKLNITKPVLYYYFKDKNDLVKQSFTEVSKKLMELRAESSKDDLSLENKIALLLKNHIAFFGKTPNAAKCALKMMAAPEHGPLKTIADEIRDKNQAILKQTLLKSVQKDEIYKSSVQDMFHIISGIIEHIIIESKKGTNFDSKFHKRMAKFLCAGAVKK
ncbi:MAG: TetR/AcrR family transcriptional regulator [Elusimicrobiales bacterium]|nr:TetR/AcrR family transcriptional regulator [Elusimicrobiales bacterium]